MVESGTVNQRGRVTLTTADRDSVSDSPDLAEACLVIAIVTFKRPERLSRTLELVGEQLSGLMAANLVKSCSIVVIDNDPDQSALSHVDATYSGIPTRYAAESKPGIPAARNRALKESAAEDLLAFIDDDEVPLAGWISSLLDTWSKYGKPTAVAGRVVSIFAPDVDPWILESGLFQRGQNPTGTPVTTAATGNLLLDLNQVRSLDVRFDERIGLGGGSDTLFTRALNQRGARMVWCNESVAEDTVEPERQTRSWALKRAFSHGNVATSVRLRLEDRPARRLLIRVQSATGGSARVVVGYARTAFGLLARSTRHNARGRRLAWRGAGMVSASFGKAYHAYARSTTS